MYTITTEHCKIISGGDFIPLVSDWWFDDAALLWGAAAFGLAYLANGVERHQYTPCQFVKIATFSAIYMGAIVLIGEKAINALSGDWI